MALRVLFAGTPEAALPALRACVESEHEVVHVLSQPPRPRGRSGSALASPVHTMATDLELPVETPEDLQSDGLEAVLAARPEVGVVVAYGHILRRAWLEALPLGWINLHFSLLPRWRGAAPVAAAIRGGDTATGVSVIRVVRKLDAGPVLATCGTPIGESETAGGLEERLAEIGAPLVVDVLGALAGGGRVVGKPQDEAQATYAPTLKKVDGTVPWPAEATSIERHVRAMQPWPGASTRLLVGDRPKPLDVKLLRVEPTLLGGGEPGEVLDVSGDSGLVGAGTGAVRVFSLQPAGKRAQPWRDFCNGYRVSTGDRFA